jgi:hypothetical protein
MSSEPGETKEVSQKSPFAGCAILIAAVSVMLFLIIFSVVVLFRQFDAISKFTGEEPAEIEVVSLEDRETELNQLAEKLEAFRLKVEADESAVLELTPAEINLAIATYDSFKDLRGMFRVREITSELMRFDISFELNGKPRLPKEGEAGIMGSDSRYLNGILVAEPGLLSREFVLKVVDIEVEGADVPKEFLEQMSPYRIAERYVGGEGIGKLMAQLTDVSLGEGVLRFEKKEGEVPKDTISNEQVDDASQRLFTFLGIAASIFLFIVAIILFFGLRLKKRQDRAVS